MTLRHVDLVEPRSYVEWWYAHARDALRGAREAAERADNAKRADDVLFWRVVVFSYVLQAIDARGQARRARYA